MRLLISVCYILLGLQLGLSQNYQFKIKSIGVEDGLTDRNISAIFQDKDGFMWFGSQFGLNRYDASRVTQYTKSQGHLLFDNIEWIAEDYQNNFWIIGQDIDNENRRSIQVFNPKTRKSIRLRNYLNQELPFDVSKVTTVQSYYSSNALWLIIDNKAFVFDPQSNGQMRLVYESTIPILANVAAPSGLWFYEGGRYKLINSKGVIIREVESAGGYEGSIFGINDNDEIFFADDIISSEDPSKILAQSVVHSGLTTPEDYIYFSHLRFMGVDPYTGQQWRSYQDGFGIFNIEGELIHKVNLGYEIMSWPGYIKFDRYGNGWANHEGKINMFRLEKIRFKNYLTDVSVFGINNYGSRGIYLDEKNNLLTNGLGLSYKIDLNTGKRVVFGPSDKFYYGKSADQGAFKRLALIADKKGNLWYTDEGYRVAKYSPNTKSFTDYTYLPEEIEYNENDQDPISLIIHWSALVDRNDKLWLGKRNGLAFKEPYENGIRLFKNYGQYPELRKAEIFSLYENDLGIWIGSTTGLYRMDFSGEILERFHTGGKEGNYIPFNAIAHIREDESGKIWLATKGGGLIQLDIENGDYKQWTTADGLSDNVIYASLKDEYNNIWVSSNKGIMKISLEDFSVSTYLQGDGLSYEEFNTGSYFKADDGRIFFGNIDGITEFNPADFIENQDGELSLRLVKLEKQQKKTGLYQDFTTLLLDEETITLQPQELGFLLEFTLLDYLNAEYNSFSYKIEGLDADWTYINQPAIRLNALPYGNHQLKIRGQGVRGQWSEEITVPIEIVRPIYMRWWFIVLMVFVIAFITFLFIRSRLLRLQENQLKLELEVKKRTQKISEQAEELRSMDKLKSRFFANVSHELRTPLTLVLGPVSNLLKEEPPEHIKNELLRVERNANSMSNLVEEILDLSRLEAKQLKIEKSPTKTKEFFEVLFSNFLSKARLKDIQYDYEYSGNSEESLQLDQRLIGRIVTNLLSNAFKFTPQAGSVKLAVISSKEHLYIEVIDTGMGISQNDMPYVFERYFQTKETDKKVQGGMGIGLAMSKELAELLDGDLFIQNTSQQGTTFILKLPKTLSLHKTQNVPPLVDTNLDDKEGEIPDDFVTQANLLIVEDNLELQEYLKQVLGGFKSLSIGNNGKEALKIMQDSGLPDVIISDLMMPEMDGLEFLEHIRGQEETKSIPLLMLTARSAEEDKLKAFTLGVDDYLLKPFSVDELKARLKNLLKNAESRKIALKLESEHSTIEESLNPKENWLKELEEIVETNLNAIDFNIATVAEKIGLSERQLQRNLKKETGLTPVVFVKEIRLQKARSYLEHKTYNKVSDISSSVGFTSTAYFSKQFKDRFGKLPSDYLN